MHVIGLLRPRIFTTDISEGRCRWDTKSGAHRAFASPRSHDEHDEAFTMAGYDQVYVFLRTVVRLGECLVRHVSQHASGADSSDTGSFGSVQALPGFINSFGQVLPSGAMGFPSWQTSAMNSCRCILVDEADATGVSGRERSLG